MHSVDPEHPSEPGRCCSQRIEFAFAVTNGTMPGEIKDDAVTLFASGLYAQQAEQARNVNLAGGTSHLAHGSMSTRMH